MGSSVILIDRRMANSKKNVVCAGCVVFRMNENGGIDFLLVRHEKDKDGHYGFPKGHTELLESIEECAVRETWEETGVVSRLLYEAMPVFTTNKNEFKIVHFFIAKQLNPQQGIQKKIGEIKEAKWFPITELPKIHEYQKPVAKFATNLFLNNFYN